MVFDLTGKVAIVTGGASGIGAGIVSCMAQQGASVIIADLDKEGADRTAKAASASGKGAVTALRVDVTKDDDIVRMTEKVIGQFGKLDILINNAGISGRPTKPFTWQEDEDWDLVFEVNVKAIRRTVKAVAPHFVERKSGRIINISSIAGFMPGPMKPAYSVSKASVAILTMLMAKEFAPYGVTANAIGPGILWTSLWEKLAKQLKEIHPELAEMSDREIFENHMRKITPMGREQTPEEIGWAAVYFASDEARNVTGQLLFVDGGVVMRP